MVTKDKSDPKGPKGTEEKAAKKPAGSKKAEAKKLKKGERQPYTGTHGYTEEEVNEIVKKQRKERK